MSGLTTSKKHMGIIFFAILLTKSNSKEKKDFLGLISELQLSTFGNKLVN